MLTREYVDLYNIAIRILYLLIYIRTLVLLIGLSSQSTSLNDIWRVLIKYKSRFSDFWGA